MAGFKVTGSVWVVRETTERYPATQIFSDEKSACEFWKRRAPDDPWDEPIEYEVTTYAE